MRVCLIEGDPHYVAGRCVDQADDESLARVDRHNDVLPIIEGMKIQYYFDDPVSEGVLTDFPYMHATGHLLLSDRAAGILGPILSEAGVVLDAGVFKGRNYKLFVCYTQIDALDRDRTVYYPEDEFGPNKIKSYAFKPEAIGDVAIFRVKGVICRLFVTEAFFDRMAGHHLTGLQVRPLWSNRTGPLAVFDDPALEFDRYPPGFGTTKREKRQAMRDIIASLR